jgi:HSP20 family protein
MKKAYYPFYPVRSFGQVFDSVFSKSLGDVVGHDAPISYPAVNIKENDNEFLIYVAAPGLEKTKFNVSIDHDKLTISYEDTTTNELVEGEKYTRREFSYSSFARSFKVTDDILKDKISAEYNDGVLVVKCPKNKVFIDNKVKNIEIV